MFEYSEFGFRFEQTPWYVDVPYTFFFSRLYEKKEIVNRLLNSDLTISGKLLGLKTIVSRINERFLEVMCSQVTNNKIDRKWLDFVRLVIIEQRERSRKITLDFEIDWEKFWHFLQEFSSLDLKLWMKYEYLRLCQIPSEGVHIRSFTFSYVKNSVKKASVDFLHLSIDIVNSLIETIDEAFVQTVNDSGSVMYFFVPQAISEFYILREIISKGHVTIFYRETRYFLENLYFTYLEDILWKRSSMHREEVMSIILSISRAWLDSFRSRNNENKDENHIIDLKKLLRKLSSLFPDNNGFSKSKIRKLSEQLSKNITMPVMLGLLSVNEEFVPGGLRNILIDLNAKNFKGYALEDFENMTSKLSVPSDLKADLRRRFIHIIEGKDLVFPAFPTPSTLGQLVSNFLGERDFNDIYDDYSFFVHAYTGNWEPIPFNSVLSQMILTYELQRVNTLIDRLLLSLEE